MILDFDQIEKIKCSRIGIIPYVKRSDGIYFMMGIDFRTRDVCDFGGRLDKGESNIQAAIREFMEESRQIIEPSQLRTVSCGVYDKRNSICILFCEVTKDNFYEKSRELFNASPFLEELQEMIDIIWFTKDEMIEQIYGYPSRFWNRVKFALRNCADFNDELLSRL